MSCIKRFIFYMIFILSAFLMNIKAFSAPYNSYGTYNKNSLSIVSYSENWNNDKLEKLYNELLNNFHGSEFKYLKNIYLYPDSPYGVNGYYIEDISLDKKGNYVLGDNACIKLFNADRYTTVEEMAPFLTHEYGHHYTIYNITKYENKYYNEWKDSKYGKIRNFEEYPVIYSLNDPNYIYRWDVTEIAAEDYSQLLGSKTGKISTDYKDSLENLEARIQEQYYSTDSFNLMPQDNLILPLAADIEGLYKYLLNISEHTAEQQSLIKKTEIYPITVTELPFNSKQYKLKWSEAQGNGPFEYTVVLYPSNNPSVPTPIKTVVTGENLEAVFGSAVEINDDGSAYVLFKEYEGEYIIKIFIKDANGFMFSTEPYIYNFDTENKNSLYLSYNNSNENLINKIEENQKFENTKNEILLNKFELIDIPKICDIIKPQKYKYLNTLIFICIPALFFNKRKYNIFMFLSKIIFRTYKQKLL